MSRSKPLKADIYCLIDNLETSKTPIYKTSIFSESLEELSESISKLMREKWDGLKDGGKIDDHHQCGRFAILGRLSMDAFDY